MAELQQDTEKYVELRNINKAYGTFKASNNINLGIGKGKLIALLGPSGSGKTTILRMIAGLETADSGDIIIDGKVVNDVPASKRGIGFVFQNYALFRYMTVYDRFQTAAALERDISSSTGIPAGQMSWHARDFPQPSK